METPFFKVNFDLLSKLTISFTGGPGPISMYVLPTYEDLAHEQQQEQHRCENLSPSRGLDQIDPKIFLAQ
jgi:hypothetical protein